MFKIKGDSLLFKGKYGFTKVKQLSPEYFVYGQGVTREVNYIRKPTYLFLTRLIQKYNIQL